MDISLYFTASIVKDFVSQVTLVKRNFIIRGFFSSAIKSINVPSADMVEVAAHAHCVVHQFS
jgi:hypothetical protein